MFIIGISEYDCNLYFGGITRESRSEGFPERDILSMGHGPGTFPELFACRRVRLLVDSSNLCEFMRTSLYCLGFGKDFICVRDLGEV